MNDSHHNQMVKLAGNLCGSLACFSVGFAIFVVILSFTIFFYRIEVWAVVSIMIGIAFAGIFTRLTLFLSNYQDYKPNDVFTPMGKHLVCFSVIGVLLGLVVSGVYNAPYPNQMCYEIIVDKDPGHSEEAQIGCEEYRYGVQQFLNGVFVAFPIVIVIMFVARMIYGVSRFTHNKQAENS